LESFGHTLGSFWAHFGHTLGTFGALHLLRCENTFGQNLISLRILGLDNFWAAFGQLLGNFWATFGQLLGNFWATFGQPLGSFL